MSGNMFDPPFVYMIDSGTFWRCDHGYTRFGDETCWRCAIKRPRRWWKYAALPAVRGWWAP